MLAIKISVPIASFRVPTSREYRESYRFPPPSTLFGCLLSIAGVHRDKDNSCQYEDTTLAIASLSQPSKSTMLRKINNQKFSAPGKGTDNKAGHYLSKPAFCEVVTGTDLIVWIRGQIAGNIRQAIEQPATVPRSGPLYLGESFGLVNDLYIVEENEHKAMNGFMLQQSDSGTSYPSKVIGEKRHAMTNTKFCKLSLVRWNGDSPTDDCFVEVG